jgi:GT2 family glycosyltransferase/Tfp pilus assembly protein PilF
MRDMAQADENIAAVGSKLLYPDRTIQHAGIVILDDRLNKDPLLARNHLVKKPSNAPEANVATTYQALTAACLLVRSQDFDKVGGFDEGFWNGYEDVDLCFRLRANGGQLVYQPQSIVIHHESQSGPERFRKAAANITRLHTKWLEVITPDAIIDYDGQVTKTDADIIQPYQLPNVQPAIVVPAHIKARKSDLVSIVILTFNELVYTQECVASIRQHTPEPHEIIFVDNGSTDGTLDWLHALVKSVDNYFLIANKDNLGFAKGCNQGIKAASGEFILLLNNDVVVSPRWLAGMLTCLQHEKDIGIVGPMTNNISGPQKVPVIGYKALNRLAAYSSRFYKQNQHRRIMQDRIVGFCMLFKHELIDRIGMLDEQFGSGNFEDDDFCLRSVLAGYRNMIAGDVFIHHYGSRSFIGNKIDYRSALSANRKIYDQKWSGIDRSNELGKSVLVLNTRLKVMEYYHLGQHDKCVSTLLQGIQQLPHERQLCYLLAEIMIDAKQFQEALQVLDALKSEPADDRQAILKGYCLEGLERYRDAGEIVQQILTKDPLSAPALNLKGMLAYRQKDRQSALRFFQQAIKSDPGYGEPYTNIGILRWQADEKKKALFFLQRGFLLAPTVSDGVTNYHAAVGAAGAYADALIAFREARALFPLNKRIAFLYIDILIQLGKNPAAMDQIEQAMIAFGIKEGILDAGLKIRKALGPIKIKKSKKIRNTISLCMHVRDAEGELPAYLKFIKPYVDEFIVVDSGSLDRTQDVAKVFGAHVFEFDVKNNINELRSLALNKAAGDWLLILDADELIAPEDFSALKQFLRKNTVPAAYAFNCQNYIPSPDNKNVWTPNSGNNPTEEAGLGWIGSKSVRLFPNDKRIRFRQSGNNTLDQLLTKLGIPIKHASIVIHCYRKMQADKQEADSARLSFREPIANAALPIRKNSIAEKTKWNISQVIH